MTKQSTEKDGMEHIILILYLFGFSLGLASIFLVFALYFQYRRKEIRYYGLLLFSWILLFSVQAAQVYLRVFFQEGIPASHPVLFRLVAFHVSLTLMIYPPLMHILLGIPFKGLRKIIFLTVDVLAVLMFLAALFSWFRGTEKIFPLPGLLLFLVMLYGMVLFWRHRKEIGHPFLKKSLEIFFIIQVFLVFSGFFIRIFAEPRHPFFSPRMYNLPLLTAFMVFHFFNLYFSLKYFNTPSYMEDGQITEFFLKHYRLTDREKEIVTLVCQGFSNSDTAKKLFISQKTVETHLYNIFQKTGVKNRTQLLNLLYSKTRLSS